MKSYKKLEKFKNLNSVCLIAHVNPDVDALCSLYVMQEFLTNHFNVKHIDLFAEYETLPSNYLSLLGKLKINVVPKKYDGAIVLDCPNLERLGKFKPLFDKAKLTCVIDHHNTNQIKANINIVEIVSSCCEIIYSIMKAFNYTPTAESKVKIYSGIITDTNNFSVGAVNKRTYNVAGDCIDCVDIEDTYNQYFNTHSLSNMMVLAAAINNIKASENNQILITHITKAEAKKLNVSEMDYIGVSNRMAAIQNNKLMCFIRPQNGQFYVSMRAKKGFDVSAFAKSMGGGGHAGAAAYLANKTLTEIEAEVFKQFKLILKAGK